MMTDEKIKAQFCAAAATGAELLDARLPGWEAHVPSASLTWEHPRRRYPPGTIYRPGLTPRPLVGILAHLFDSHFDGLRELGIQFGSSQVFALGFDHWTEGLTHEDQSADSERLRLAWLSELALRR